MQVTDAALRLDENMEELVRVLNELPGVFTCSSCGGHGPEDGPAEGRLPAGEFVVEFVLDDDDPGSLSSLALITCFSQSVSDFDDPGKGTVHVMPWYDGDLHFDIRGSGVSPVVLADAIRAELVSIEAEFDSSSMN